MYLYLVINPEIRKSVGEGGEEIGNRDNGNNKKFVRSVDMFKVMFEKVGYFLLPFH